MNDLWWEEKQAMLALFPTYSEIIPQLIDQNQDFRETVQDYLLCRKTLDAQPAAGINIKLAGEYQETLMELKDELLLYLKALETNKS